MTSNGERRLNEKAPRLGLLRDGDEIEEEEVAAGGGGSGAGPVTGLTLRSGSLSFSRGGVFSLPSVRDSARPKEVANGGIRRIGNINHSVAPVEQDGIDGGAIGGDPRGVEPVTVPSLFPGWMSLFYHRGFDESIAMVHGWLHVHYDLWMYDFRGAWCSMGVFPSWKLSCAQYIGVAHSLRMAWWKWRKPLIELRARHPGVIVGHGFGHGWICDYGLTREELEKGGGGVAVTWFPAAT